MLRCIIWRSQIKSLVSLIFDDFVSKNGLNPRSKNSWNFMKRAWREQKIPFKITRRYENSIWQVFLIRNSQIRGSFICYFWLMTTSSNQKLKKVKYSFWLQKSVKKFNLTSFSDPRPPNFGWFHLLLLI